MGPLEVVVLVIGILLFVAMLLAGIFLLGGRATTMMIEKVEREGVLLRTGRRTIAVTLRDFRDVGRYQSYRRSLNRGEVLIVTNAVAVIAGLFGIRLPLDDLPHAQVWLDGREVHLRTSKLPRGTGTIEIAFEADDPTLWLRTLNAHGARPPA
ncbi:MAG: hypothetical protein HYV09_19070 [Deltaproteobacteria bacterium]|nr:hypothetical protein [Deltaproteobacteria bacterium]